MLVYLCVFHWSVTFRQAIFPMKSSCVAVTVGFISGYIHKVNLKVWVQFCSCAFLTLSLVKSCSRYSLYLSAYSDFVNKAGTVLWTLIDATGHKRFVWTDCSQVLLQQPLVCYWKSPHMLGLQRGLNPWQKLLSLKVWWEHRVLVDRTCMCRYEYVYHARINNYWGTQIHFKFCFFLLYHIWSICIFV